MLIVNLNFAAEQVAGLLKKIGYETLIIKEIHWVCGSPDFCRPVFIPTLYIVLPNGTVKDANDFFSTALKNNIFSLLKIAS